MQNQRSFYFYYICHRAKTQTTYRLVFFFAGHDGCAASRDDAASSPQCWSRKVQSGRTFDFGRTRTHQPVRCLMQFNQLQRRSSVKCRSTSCLHAKYCCIQTGFGWANHRSDEFYLSKQNNPTRTPICSGFRFIYSFYFFSSPVASGATPGLNHFAPDPSLQGNSVGTKFHIFFEIRFPKTFHFLDGEPASPSERTVDDIYFSI